MCSVGTWIENTGTSPYLIVKPFRESPLKSHSKISQSPPPNNHPLIHYHWKSFKKKTPNAIAAVYQKVLLAFLSRSQSPPPNNRPLIHFHSKSFKKRTPNAIVAVYQKVLLAFLSRNQFQIGQFRESQKQYEPNRLLLKLRILTPGRLPLESVFTVSAG
jgi:hypothetical protein